MNINEIRKGVIYKAVNLPEKCDVFAYIHKCNKKEVAFSVLDEAVENPDFSNCGMFWVRPQEFTLLFEVYQKKQYEN
ncbi:MAG: hypothetical protein Q4C46_00610 [Bacillota bacterium]|nr:hypothetical protein [Bacillota bacterium]